MIIEAIPWYFYLCCGFALLINILWLWIKYINKSKGYKISFIFHFDDLKNLKEIIRDEPEKTNAKRYLKILYALYGSIIVFVILSGLVFLEVGSRKHG